MMLDSRKYREIPNHAYLSTVTVCMCANRFEKNRIFSAPLTQYLSEMLVRIWDILIDLGRRDYYLKLRIA